LGIRNEVVSCDTSHASWLGRDSFPIHALGPGKYGFAYTAKLGPWLEENLERFDAVIVHGLWLWPSVCATRAVARERRRRLKDQEAKRLRGEEVEQRIFSHGLTRIDEDKSERRAADRTRGNAASSVTWAGGGLSTESFNPQRSTLNSKQLRCFVMPHGMLDPWFQRDKSRRVKAVRNWFYWWLVERNVVSSADALLFTCQPELELARTTFGGYKPKKEINVGYGIAEPPAFEPKMREAFEARCPGLNARPYLLFMSRVHPKKGVDLLVRAYARVRSEHNKGIFSHGLTRIDADESERLAADRTTGNASCRVTPAVGSQSRQPGKEHDAFPDLVVAGPGWDSDYGERIKELIRERGAGGGEQGAIHAVDTLSGAAKWGALYGCEAFVLPSHQENFGIAVVEALACGKPVLISDQVNIWREIVEDGAGIAEADTEEGVVKLLRKFLSTQKDEVGDLRPEVGDQYSEFGHSRVCETAEGKLTRIDADGSERLAADRTMENAALQMTSKRGGLSSETAEGAPRACYLKRFAIGPAAAKLAEVVKH
jgi:glycosyltransferase involved in cell wall biosynthesis